MKAGLENILKEFFLITPKNQVEKVKTIFNIKYDKKNDKLLIAMFT